jgi:hypothetical protein
MANLYNKAGLVNIPIGYSDGFLYNIKPVDDTLAFRFNRDSAATRVNKEGLIEQVGYFSPELVQNGNFSELGPELVVNGDFATDSDWNLQSSASISQNKLIVSNAAQNTTIATQSSVAPTQKPCKLQFDIVVNTGSFRILLGSNGTTTTVTESGTYTLYETSGNFGTLTLQARDGGFDGSIDNISVKQVDPNDYWSLGTGWGFGDNKAICDGTQTGNTSIQQSNIAEIGKKYKIKFDLVVTSGFINYVNLGGWIDQTNLTTSGTYVVYTSTTTATDNLGLAGDVNFIGSITNISVTEVKGDKPRIDYTDSLTSPSFLLEPQSTNLVTYSEDFSQWGVVNGAVVTDNFITSPDGTQNAAKIVYNGTSSGRIEIATSASGTNTQSIYLKTASGTQAVSIGASSGSLTEVTVTSEWQRFSHTGSGSYPRVLCNDASTIYAWGAQHEQGSYATSYIPTAGSTVTRAAETCVGAGNASTFNDSEGVLYAEIAALANDGTFRVLSVSDGSNNNIVKAGYRFDSDAIYYEVRSGGTSQAFQIYTTIDVKQFNKVAVLYQQNNFKLYINGTNVLSDVSGITPVGLNYLSFNAGGASDFYGKTKGVYVFNEALTDDELQQLTGPDYNSFAALAAAYNYTVI